MNNSSLRRPRVLHLRVVAGTGGGPEKTILNSPKFIREFGYDAQVVYLCPSGDAVTTSLQERALAAQCPLTILTDHGPLDFTLIPRLLRICRRDRIDVLQTHDYKSNFIGLIIRRLHRCRLATTLHGWTDMSGRMPIYKRIDQWCLPGYEALICVSDDLLEECKRLRVPQSKLHLIYNAIDIQAFRRTQSVAEAKVLVDARPGRFLIGSVGRLSPEKCFLELVDVVVRLQQRGHPVDLWIAGDGRQRPELEHRIAEHGCQDSVRLLGQINDPIGFYQAMDLFVLNSIREGLPNVVLEAMALETPVIATEIAGIPRLIKDGDTGRLVPPSNANRLEQAIERAIAEPLSQNELKHRARRLIESDFSFEVRMQKVAAIYDRLLGIVR